MRNVPLDFDANAKSNESGQAAMGHCGVEFYPDHVDVVRSGLLDDDIVLIHHIQVLERLRLLGISYGAQVICE